MSEQLSNNIKITKIKAGQNAATTDVESDVLDMQGYEGVLMFTTIAVANSGNYLKAQQGDASDGSDMADLEDSKVVAAENNQVVWLDIYKPQKRYVRAYIERGGATTATGDIYALQYNGRVGLESNLTDDVIIGKLLISPDEGTA